MRSRLLAPLLLLVACSGPEADDVVLEEDTATSLAQHAGRLAVFLEEQEPCDALTTADELRTRARDGVSAGTVPADVANEVEAVLEEVTGPLSCDDGDGQGDSDDGGGQGGGDGDEGGPAQDPGAGDDGGDGGGSDQEDPPPDPERGPEGDGPPGQDDNGDPGGNGDRGPEDEGPPGRTEATRSGRPGKRT